MAKKKGTLASFGQVAGTNNGNNNDTDNTTNINTDIDNNFATNINNGDNTNIDNGNEDDKEIIVETNNKNNNKEVTDSMSILETITKKPKAPKKRQIAIYLDEDVAATLDRHAKKHGKGFKSELINELLKNELLKNK